MDESLALLRQISLSLQALSLEVHRQGRTLSRVQELVEELHPGADYEVVSQPPASGAGFFFRFACRACFPDRGLACL